MGGRADCRYWGEESGWERNGLVDGAENGFWEFGNGRDSSSETWVALWVKMTPVSYPIVNEYCDSVFGCQQNAVGERQARVVGTWRDRG